MDGRFINVELEYDSESKKCQLGFGDHYKIEGRAEEVKSLSHKESFLSNTLNSRGYYGVAPIGYDHQRNLVLTETYEMSLAVLVRDKGRQWWEDTQLHGWRMKPYLQMIIKKIIDGIVDLCKKKVNYNFTMDSIVFVDDHYNSPILRSMWTSEGPFLPKNLWIALGKMVKEIVKESLFDKARPHPEVKEFIKMLTEKCVRANSQFMREHPSLLSQSERLSLIVKFRDNARSGVIDTLGKTSIKDRVNVSVVGTWDEVVQKINLLKTNLKHWQKDLDKHNKIGDAPLTPPIRTAYFIRNCYLHIPVTKLNVYNWRNYDDLERYFDLKFPKLASYIFDCYVNGESL